LNTIITKASTLVRFVRHSIHATEILEEEKRLQNANATRWNSQLIMIRSILLKYSRGEIQQARYCSLDNIWT
jgi:hypothetical protein